MGPNIQSKNGACSSIFTSSSDLLQQSEAHTIPSLLNPFRSVKFSVNTAVE
jgi:hypothetical protein